ncbi:MAG TPA: signal peptidase II [Bryobacteraceae bacterium]|jgi:signal peptidase II|nr:signal peptidase II [Bryobacteraceae bacterium]
MNHRLQSVAIIAAVVIIDRITKLYIRVRVSPWDVHAVIPGFFNIIHTENPGAAFGMFSESASQWRSLFLIAVSLVVMALIGWILWRPTRAGFADSALLRTGFALVLGGALGNFIDRATRGTVTDFLQFFFGTYEFPSFNAADSAITIGAGLLLIDLWRTRGKKELAANERE